MFAVQEQLVEHHQMEEELNKVRQVGVICFCVANTISISLLFRPVKSIRTEIKAQTHTHKLRQTGHVTMVMVNFMVKKLQLCW